jgi:ABC-type dipeptide/oligopeptide/nickel transport system permease component
MIILYYISIFIWLLGIIFCFYGSVEYFKILFNKEYSEETKDENNLELWKKIQLPGLLMLIISFIIYYNVKNYVIF